jgi:hypothetical protein
MERCRLRAYMKHCLEVTVTAMVRGALDAIIECWLAVWHMVAGLVMYSGDTSSLWRECSQRERRVKLCEERLKVTHISNVAWPHCTIWWDTKAHPCDPLAYPTAHVKTTAAQDGQCQLERLSVPYVHLWILFIL